MKIEMDDKGKLYINDELKTIKDLDAITLEKIVDELLHDNCEMDLNIDNPLANFFRALDEKTADGSDLKREITERKEEQGKLEKTLKSLDTSYEHAEVEND